MPSLHCKKNHLPANFPEKVVVMLRRDEEGSEQFWAPILHDRQIRKLLIDPAGEQLYAGEEWEVQPVWSPNGRVIFCAPLLRRKAVTGHEPLLARLKEYAESRSPVTVEKNGSMSEQPRCERGSLDRAYLEGDELVILMREPYGGASCPLDEVEWHEGKDGAFVVSLKNARGRYKVTFREHQSS